MLKVIIDRLKAECAKDHAHLQDAESVIFGKEYQLEYLSGGEPFFYDEVGDMHFGVDSDNPDDSIYEFYYVEDDDYEGAE